MSVGLQTMKSHDLFREKRTTVHLKPENDNRVLPKQYAARGLHGGGEKAGVGGEKREQKPQSSQPAETLQCTRVLIQTITDNS